MKVRCYSCLSSSKSWLEKWTLVIPLQQAGHFLLLSLVSGCSAKENTCSPEALRVAFPQELRRAVIFPRVPAFLLSAALPPFLHVVLCQVGPTVLGRVHSAGLHWCGTQEYRRGQSSLQPGPMWTYQQDTDSMIRGLNPEEESHYHCPASLVVVLPEKQSRTWVLFVEQGLKIKEDFAKQKEWDRTFWVKWTALAWKLFSSTHFQFVDNHSVLDRFTVLPSWGLK